MVVDSANNSWRDEMNNYLQAVERLTETALKRIKQCRTQNQLPFDEGFKESFWQKTNAR